MGEESQPVELPALDPMQEYVGRMKDLLGLRDWQIEVIYGDQEEMASVAMTFGQKHAILVLGTSWGTYSPEDQRATIVHELIHVHVTPALDLAWKILNPIMGQATMWPLQTSVVESHEHGVDGLACSISKYFPLPPIQEPLEGEDTDAPAVSADRSASDPRGDSTNRPRPPDGGRTCAQGHERSGRSGKW